MSERPARTAVLHIGPMKTGSTSIQAWLHRNVAKLKEQGILFPVESLGRNMSRLGNMARALAMGAEPTALDRRRLDAFRAEMDALPPDIHTVVVSGEVMAEMMRDADVAKLREIFDRWFDDYRIVIYLRRQDELVLSRYTTVLRRGEREAEPLAAPPDYDEILTRWTQVFRRRSMRVRLFDRAELKDGDIVSDFADAAGLPRLPDEGKAIEFNPSLTAPAQELLRRLAEKVRDRGFAGSFRDINGHEELNRALDRHFRGKGQRPARREVVNYYRQVRKSNERVRRRWFPERETLFSDDFSDYPEIADGPPEPADVLEAALEALTWIVTAPVLSAGMSAAAHAPPKQVERVLARKERRGRDREASRVAAEADQAEM